MHSRTPFAFVLFAAVLALSPRSSPAQAPAPPPTQSVPQGGFGFTDFSSEAQQEQKFLAVPDPKLAGDDLTALTAEPHLAATPEDHKTAEFVARKFRAAGLETEIVPYRVLLDYPKAVHVEAWDESGHPLMTGPTREHVGGEGKGGDPRQGDPQQDDPRIVMPYNSSSGSGDVTGRVVYANYCRLEDFDSLAAQHIDVHGKIVMCRYGTNFRGVKVYLAEQRGAVAVLIYSDPQDDGYYKGDPYPNGPWRPDTGVQRGSVQYLFKYSGDPETPGVASTLDLPDSARIKDFAGPDGNQPRIISIPLSGHDAAPILAALKGPGAPQGWQGALPFPYHLGPAGVKIHVVSQQDYQRRIIWDVIGKIPGAADPDAPVIVGNHRDAWVYGAVDPSSGTAAMLEAVRGLGVLLHQGWRPRRTIIFCSWDAEEEGLMGSTEWVEQQGHALDRAVAYFNVDVAVSGPNFSASAVPSLKDFVRDIARSVPSPVSGSVFLQWRKKGPGSDDHSGSNAPAIEGEEVHVGDLGSGSDFTPFLQHAGVPSTDVGSDGPYGVYHSAFDDMAWYKKNADPDFLYLQEMARVLGLEAMRMADADALPYDYVAYAREISAYIEAAKSKAADAGPGTGRNPDTKNALASLDFTTAEAAAARFASAAQRVRALQAAPYGDLVLLNLALRQAETALLSPAGLPNRPWYRHTIYAPGELTGYAAVVIPGVNEAIDSRNASLAAQQLTELAQALDRAVKALASAH